MIYFEAQKGNAVAYTITAKVCEKASAVWYRLMEEHRKFPMEILKVSPVSVEKENVFEVVVANQNSREFERFIPAIGCMVNSKRKVVTARPILASVKEEVVVLPAITGVFDSDIEDE